MNKQDRLDFIEIMFKLIQSSAWSYEDAERELSKWMEIEQSIWKKQEHETNSVFSGKFYL